MHLFQYFSTLIFSAQNLNIINKIGILKKRWNYVRKLANLSSSQIAFSSSSSSTLLTLDTDAEDLQSSRSCQPTKKKYLSKMRQFFYIQQFFCFVLVSGLKESLNGVKQTDEGLISAIKEQMINQPSKGWWRCSVPSSSSLWICCQLANKWGKVFNPYLLSVSML